jgi:repressor LexA
MESLTDAQQELYDWLVEYIHINRHSPSIRQMMHAMGLKSPAPVQSRLDHLRSKGYIDWTEGRARTIRLLLDTPTGIPIQGAIAAGSMVEVFPDDDVEELDLSTLALNPQYFALRVNGDSMIDALIDSGDIVIMKPANDPKAIKNGTIVAARVESTTTLKYYQRKGNKVTLEPANQRYKPIELSATDVQIDGVLVGVWRGYGVP